MNSITRKLLPLFLLSSSAGSPLKTMDTEGRILEMSLTLQRNKDIMRGVKGLPKELQLYIISLLLQHKLCRPFFWRTIHLESDQNVNLVASSPDGETIFFGVNNTKPFFCSSRTLASRSLLTEPTDGISSGAWSSDGEKVLTGSFRVYTILE